MFECFVCPGVARLACLGFVECCRIGSSREASVDISSLNIFRASRLASQSLDSSQMQLHDTKCTWFPRKQAETKAKAMKAARRALVQAELPAVLAATFAGNLFCFQPSPMYSFDVVLLFFA